MGALGEGRDGALGEGKDEGLLCLTFDSRSYTIIVVIFYLCAGKENG